MNNTLKRCHTNLYRMQFDNLTKNENRLLNMKYIKYTYYYNNIEYYYLSKTFSDKKIVYLLFPAFQSYMKFKYNISIYSSSDEIFIIEYNSGRKVIHILDKNKQNIENSVETKLWSGPSLKRDYEFALSNNFEVYYAFCVNNYIKNKLLSFQQKYLTLNTILNESNIIVLFGEDNNYFNTLDSWLKFSL